MAISELPILSQVFGASQKEQEADQAALDSILQGRAAFDSLVAPTTRIPDVIPYQNLASITGSAPVSYELADPRLATSAQVGPSSYEGITTDPRLQDAQLAALSSLQAISEGGGLTDQDKANLARIQSQVQQEARGRNQAIMQNAQARGMSGSGMELLSKLQNSQDATNRESQQGLDIAGMAQARALQALAQGGSLAGDIRGQQFNEQSSKAAAKDAIDKFNAQLIQQSNLANQNAANEFAKSRAAGTYGAASDNANRAMETQKFNATGAQNASNLNTEAQNSRAMAKAELPQQSFDNQYKIAAGKSALTPTETSYYGGVGAREAKKNSDLAGAGIAAIAAMLMA